jgi:hypothetical protein
MQKMALLWKQIDEATIYNDKHYADLRTARIVAIMLERFITYNADVNNTEEFGFICSLSDELISFITYVETLKQ